jgi:carbon storage regulator
MLVLARKTGQSIILGDGIEVTVIEVRGEQVRLGITAPRSVPVHRKELLEQVRTENDQASAVTPEAVGDPDGDGHNRKVITKNADERNLGAA